MGCHRHSRSRSQSAELGSDDNLSEYVPMQWCVLGLLIASRMCHYGNCLRPFNA